jgi:hypothetical protein
MASKRTSKLASHVRVVTAEERPPSSKPKTLNEAVADGDYLEILRAQRREIVTSLPDERGPAKAALHRQLALISKEIQTMEFSALDNKDSVVAKTDDDTWDQSVI